MILRYFVLMLSCIGAAASLGSTSKEQEIKRVLTPSGFDKLFKELTKLGASTIVQTNHYLDTPRMDLRQLGDSLRVRSLNDKSELTYMQKIGEKNGVFERVELECILPNEIAEKLISGTMNLVQLRNKQCPKKTQSSHHPLVTLSQRAFHSNAWRVADLAVTAQSKTQRTIHPIKLNGIELVFELDYTQFPKGLRGYELEVEVPKAQKPQKVMESVLSYLKKIGVSSQNAILNKSKITAAIINEDSLKVNKLLKHGSVYQHHAG